MGKLGEFRCSPLFGFLAVADLEWSDHRVATLIGLLTGEGGIGWRGRAHGITTTRGQPRLLRTYLSCESCASEERERETQFHGNLSHGGPPAFIVYLEYVGCAQYRGDCQGDEHHLRGDAATHDGGELSG